MSKIIIHNNSKMSNEDAILKVYSVMLNGFMSGPSQYCWATSTYNWAVYAEKTRGTTHTFKVEDE